MKSPFVGAAYKGRSSLVDAQECINLYPEAAPSPDSKNNVILVGTPGLKYFTAVGTGSNRGMFTTARDRLLTVVGSKLYEINSDTSYIERGILGTNQGRVEWAEIQITATGVGGSHVMLVDGVYGYIFRTDVNSFTRITGDYKAGTSVVALSGRFVQNVNNTGSFIWSSLYDGLSWESGLNFAITEGSPDPIQSIRTINNELWMSGTKSSEVWASTGIADAPFQKIDVAYINTGISSKYAAATIQNNIFWVGANNQGQGSVWQASGYLPARISTHSIEYIINSMPDISDCVAYSYEQEGHQFIVWNFPTGNRTLVYDVVSGLWHERGSYNQQTGKNDYHRAVMATLWYNKVMVGDYANSNIYELDLNTYLDNGVTIKRVRAAPHLHNDRKRLFFSSLELDMERGTGLLPTSDSTSYSYTADPQVMLQWSDDGGSTWSNEYWQASGKIGKRTSRVKWNRLGMSRDRVFKATFTAPVRWIVVDASMNVTAE